MASYRSIFDDAKLFRLLYVKEGKGVNEMIGRNDPCLCGSGKKYKKCCLGKNEQTIDTLIEDELERIIRSMYEQPRTRAELAVYETHRNEWLEKLGKHWDEKSVDVAATEYFLFVEQRKLWQDYLEGVLNNPLRDAVRSIVEDWKDPVVLFGKVESEQDGFVKVKEILGDETFTLEVGQDLEKEKDVIVFGVGLRDNRAQNNGLYTLTSFMFIKDMNQSFETDVVNLIKSSELDPKLGFYQKHMVDVYALMFDRDNSSIDDLISTKLSDDQQEALTMIQDVLDDVEVIPEAKELVQNITITYFLKEKPRFRKPNVIAAAVFNVALDLKILGELTMTNREVAERFDVSTSSIKTHAERIQVFVENMLKQTQAK